MKNVFIKLSMLLALSFPLLAQAATHTVTNCEDNGSSGTLRVLATTTASNPGDTIVIPASCPTITLTTAAGGDINIIKSINISGQGPAQTAIDGDAIDRVFQISPGADVVFTNLTIQNGRRVTANGGPFDGGAIYNNGNLTLNNCVVTGSTAGDTTNPGQGGGIYTSTGTLTLTNSIVSGNTSTANGGGIKVDGGTVNINQSTLSGNNASSTKSGGAIDHASGGLTITGSTISGNTATSSGGGISSGAVLTLTNSTISGNNATTIGGGISSGGSLTITGSTINGNNAASGGGINYSGGALVMANSTISSNNTTGNGGGIVTGALNDLNNVTITNNKTTNGEGGGIFNSLGAGTVTIRNTIIAKNIDLAGGSDAPDCTGVGSFSSQGNNLIGNNNFCLGFTNGVIGDKVGTSGAPLDPLLGPLQNNGGPTQTHAITSTGSPAFDAGNPAAPGSGGLACGATDQRGVTRPQATFCDMGAYEAGPAVTFNPTSLNFGDETIGIAAQETITVTSSGITALIINSIVAGSGDFSQTNNCPIGPATLTVGSTCTITVTFLASETGPRVGTITITTNAGTTTYNLTGNGISGGGGGGGGGCSLGERADSSASFFLMFLPALAIAGVLALRRKRQRH